MDVVSKGAPIIGYLTLAQLSYQLVRFLQFNLRSSSLQIYGKSHRLNKSASQHPWALITGASDGLGLVFAQKLAAKGFNLIIHGRNASKLDGIATDLVKEYSVQVRTLVIDAADQKSYDEESFRNKVLAVVDDIPLTILLNNIAIIGDWDAHHVRDAANLDKFLNINVRFSIHLAKWLIPILAKNSPGLILNVSSGASHLPLPWSAHYTGAKAYSDAFHRSMRWECQSIPEFKNIEVLTIEYGTVCTPSTGRSNADATWDIPTVDRAVEAGLGCVGCGYSTVVPYLGHQVLDWVVRLLPVNTSEQFVVDMMKKQKDRMDALLVKEK